MQQHIIGAKGRLDDGTDVLVFAFFVPQDSDTPHALIARLPLEVIPSATVRLLDVSTESSSNTNGSAPI